MRAYWGLCAAISGCLAFYIFVVDEKTWNAYAPDRGSSDNISVFQ